jgi:hypothetical protein
MSRPSIPRSRRTWAWAATAAVALTLGAGAAAVSLSPHAAAATAKHRILFDDSKAETAGNADWIISTSKPDPTAQNASPSAETDWTGAISSWGVALQKTGDYTLKTNTSALTYGSSSNALDLSNFDELVLPEPNILLSAAEKTAVMKFVQNGGGLFLIVDHTGSDRNNDGADSDAVVNDLMTNNSVDSTDPFGFSVDLKNIVNDYPKAISDSTDPVLHGSFGTVTGSVIYTGTTETLHPADNSAVKGLLYVTTATSGGTTGAFFTTSRFGSGRVAVWGDSSAIDDGTGESGKSLYDGWNDTGGTDAALALNATAWLAGTGTASSSSPSTSASASASASPSPSASSTGGGSGSCTGANLLGNPGFETGSASPWTASTGVVYSGTKEPARTGGYDAWLDGYGTATTDTLAQSVTLPSGCTSYPLSFWLHVDTAETTTSTAYDTCKVQVLNSSGTVLATLATFSNLNAASGYTQHSYSLAAYAGQTLTLKFTGTEDSEEQTSFVVDDTSITAS